MLFEHSTSFGHNSPSFIVMSPAPLSPPVKMSTATRTSPQDSADGIRKRVCKACDRCRLKKSKCDGSSPCSRCKADNAICVFGERKKSHDKVYPKGYVEMLEQQQGQLVLGLQTMYRMLSGAQAWTSPTLVEANGQPLTHDILAALELLESRHDGSGEAEAFEDDCQKLQSKLLADGAGFVARRGSVSSESDRDQHDHPRPAVKHKHTLSRPPTFRDSFDFGSAPPSPHSQSPVCMSRPIQSFPPSQPSPLQQTSPWMNDPQLFQAEWSIPDMSSPEHIMRSKIAMHAAAVQQKSSIRVDDFYQDNHFDPPALWNEAHSCLPMTSYPQQAPYGNPGDIQGSMQDFNVMDPMDVEFHKFIQVMT